MSRDIGNSRTPAASVGVRSFSTPAFSVAKLHVLSVFGTENTWGERLRAPRLLGVAVCVLQLVELGKRELCDQLPGPVLLTLREPCTWDLARTIVSIAVAEGQEVKAGEMLCIVEAMKMENVLRAERDGTIATIAAKEGDSLSVDAVILEFA